MAKACCIKAMRHDRSWLVMALLWLLCGTSPCLGQTGEAARPGGSLVFGMSTVLSGPAARLGQDMRAGVLAAFGEANRAGGIKGRTLSLEALDDGYEPERTVPNMRYLVEEREVLAVVGNVGTPNAVVAAPIASRNNTLFFGAYTGAGVLRKIPVDRYVINFRASYAEETEAMVEALLKYGGLRPDEIAFFTQRDAYGDAGFVGGIEALRRHGLADVSQVAHGRYERNSLAVENGLADVILAQPTPRAVIMVGAYAPCAKFVKLAKASTLACRFLAVSFVGADALVDALGEEGNGVIVTQVVPHFDADLALVRDYRQAVRSLDENAPLSFGALEGYIATRILLRALAAVSGPITREALVNAMDGLGRFDLGLGEPLHLAPDEHQACHRVWPTIIRHGKVVPFQWQNFSSSP